jgi:hypothetical protein
LRRKCAKTRPKKTVAGIFNIESEVSCGAEEDVVSTEMGMNVERRTDVVGTGWAWDRSVRLMFCGKIIML